MKIKRRFLSILLMVVLVFSMVPTVAFAEDDGNRCTITPNCTLEDGHEGDCIIREADENSDIASSDDKEEPEKQETGTDVDFAKDNENRCTITPNCTLEDGHEGDCIIGGGRMKILI